MFQRNRLSEHLGLSEHEVISWFKNKRNRVRYINKNYVKLKGEQVCTFLCIYAIVCKNLCKPGALIVPSILYANFQGLSQLSLSLPQSIRDVLSLIMPAAATFFHAMDSWLLFEGS